MTRLRPFSPNDLLDPFLAVGGAGVHKIAGIGDIGQRPHLFSHLFYVYGLGDVNAAVADKDPPPALPGP